MRRDGPRRRLPSRHRTRPTAAADGRCGPGPASSRPRPGLFVERGYLATTIEAIADAARRRRADRLLRLRHEAEPAGRRPRRHDRRRRRAGARARAAVDRRRSPPRPTRRRRWSCSSRRPSGSSPATAPVYEVVRRAAADPEVGELLDRQPPRPAGRPAPAGRDAGAGRAPPPDLDVDTAADVFYAVVNEEVFQLLVVDCGWPTQPFRDPALHQSSGTNCSSGTTDPRPPHAPGYAPP